MKVVNLILRHIDENKFFLAVSSALTSKFAKSAYMIPKYFFFKNAIRVKIIDADLKSVEKVAKKVINKKVTETLSF